MRPITLIKAAVCVAIAALVGPMWGCVDDLVKVDVPRDVQKATGAPARVPLSQSRALADEWREMQVEAASAAATKEKAAREDAARQLATLRTEIEDQAATRQADDAAFARTSARKLTELDAREGARAAQASADLDRLARTIEATARRFDASIASADAQAASFGGLIGQGVGIAQTAAQSSGIPGVGLLLPLLTGVAGLFLRKPGDAKKIEDANQKATDATKKADDEWTHGYKMGLAADRTVTVASSSVPTVVGAGAGT